MEALKKIHPLAYHLQFLERDCRPDGRSLSEIRKLKISPGAISSAEGSSIVQLGQTKVICGIKCEIGVPHASKPKEGKIVVNVHLPPLCSGKFSGGKPTEETLALGEYVSNLLLSTKVLDLDELCVVPNTAVWVLYADIMCLDYDGNMHDVAPLAVLAALSNLRLPETKVDEKEGEVFLIPEGESGEVKKRREIETSSCPYLTNLWQIG